MKLETSNQKDVVQVFARRWRAPGADHEPPPAGQLEVAGLGVVRLHGGQGLRPRPQQGQR